MVGNQNGNRQTILWSDKPAVSGLTHRWRMPRRNGSGIALLADPTRRGIIAALALMVPASALADPAKLQTNGGAPRLEEVSCIPLLC